MRLNLFIFIYCCPLLLLAQFAPRAGRAGTTAVHRDSSCIVSWATGCQVTRGWVDISQPDSGKATVGNADMAKDKADGSAVSLGDGGIAVLTFHSPIVNGPGADFVVFENGFNIKTSNDSDFLELAFVEVSSDGINYFRFAAISAHDTAEQLNTFDGTKATFVHNFAGKYTAGYGTPFDLDELPSDPLLDLNYITHVRVIDVVGSLIDSLATRDSQGNKVNDPWPTPFPQSGFDLDAVAVIHNVEYPTGAAEFISLYPKIYPNPLNAGSKLVVKGVEENAVIQITGMDGRIYFSGRANSINTDQLKPGIYSVLIQTVTHTYRENLLVL